MHSEALPRSICVSSSTGAAHNLTQDMNTRCAAPMTLHICTGHGAARVPFQCGGLHPRPSLLHTDARGGRGRTAGVQVCGPGVAPLTHYSMPSLHCCATAARSKQAAAVYLPLLCTLSDCADRPVAGSKDLHCFATCFVAHCSANEHLRSTCQHVGAEEN